jgi:hypothetical protein
MKLKHRLLRPDCQAYFRHRLDDIIDHLRRPPEQEQAAAIELIDDSLNQLGIKRAQQSRDHLRSLHINNVDRVRFSQSVVHISRLLSFSLALVLSSGYASRKTCLKRTRKNAASAMPASAPTGRPSTPSSRTQGGMRQDLPREGDGARADRRELLKFLKTLAPGDVVTVTRIDRLARSTFDLFAIVKQIVDAKAQFRSLAEPWADTGPAPGG